ncbi:hypothetical protein QBC34DRAFT_457155 [Podospora aff. communis PSN243]|uniref:Uncharacterized protein n=1 Tax=Podospora aff. communis PSN243 TaxID=3040156 RepID=A0AAV9GWU3_9PEZI|nr:hypothetical protein QBC34DRAFT_457155 [Podospora aff. communis PSN243]
MVWSLRLATFAVAILPGAAQIDCTQSTLTLTAPAQASSAISSCGTPVNGVTTLKNSLSINFTAVAPKVSFDPIDTIDGDIYINVYRYTYFCEGEPATCPNHPTKESVIAAAPNFSSSTLRNITGRIRVECIAHQIPAAPIPIGLPSRRLKRQETVTTADPITFDFPKLEIMDNLYATGPLDGIYANLGPSYNPVNIDATRVSDLKVDMVNSSGLYFYDNLPPRGGKASIISTATEINSTIEMWNNTGLGTISLPKLGYTRMFSIHDNPDLETLESSVTSMQYMNLTKNGPKTALFLDQLHTIGEGQREWWPYKSNHGSYLTGLAAINLPALKKTIGPTSDLRFTSNSIPDLQLSMLNSVNGSFIIEDNESLFDIGLARLQTIHADLTVSGNPRLLNFTANVLKTAASIFMAGDFTNVEFFSLESESVNFELSGAPSMDCSWFDDHFLARS